MSVDSSTPYATEMVSFRISSVKKHSPSCFGEGAAGGEGAGLSIVSDIGIGRRVATGEDRGMGSSICTTSGVNIGLISTKVSSFSCGVNTMAPNIIIETERAASN